MKENETRPVQHFTDEYLAHCARMSADEILEFLEQYRQLQFEPGPLKQINIRVPENLLRAFKAKAESENTPYQQQIKALMWKWVL